MYLHPLIPSSIILVNTAIRVKYLCLIILFPHRLYAKRRTCLTLISLKYYTNSPIFSLPLSIIALKGSPYLNKIY